MEAVFLKLLNMSITASWIVLAVLLLRLLLKKAPKAILCLLWALVGIRLVCPISFESIFSLIPSAEPIPSDILYAQTPAIQSGIPALNHTINPILSESLAPEVGNSVNPMQLLTLLASIVWIVGMVGMLLYAGISYLRIRRRVKMSISVGDHIRICDSIPSPFILGIFRPCIYLPSSLGEAESEYVLAHERAHLRRHDHWWKPLGFLLLSVYWFNPLLWVAYILLCRDIELACDERVIKELGNGCKKAYTSVLLRCSVPRKMIAACPLAFGEVGVKGRIKNVLNYRKPAFWIIAAAILLCITAAVAFLTNPAGVKLLDADRIGTPESITIETDTRSDQITDGDSIAHVLAFLDDVRVSRSEISENRSENRDKSNTVTLHYEETSIRYHFNADCTEVWQDDAVKPSLTQAVMDPQEAAAFFAAPIDGATVLPGRGQTAYLKTDSFTDCEDVDVAITALALDASPPYIEMEWSNHTGKELSYGMEFQVYRHGDGVKINCDTLPERLWITIAALLQGETGSRRLSLEGYDLSIPGDYSIEFSFSIEDGSTHTAYLNFSIGSESEAAANAPDGSYQFSVSYANFSDSDRIFLQALNRDTMYISSVQHLPIHRLDSKAELERFKADFDDILTMSQGYDEIPSFDEATADYDDAFFAEHTLFVIYVGANSGSYRFGVGDIYNDGESFSVNVVQLNDPELVTQDMAGWFVTVTAEKAAVEHCTTFDAVLNHTVYATEPSGAESICINTLYSSSFGSKLSDEDASAVLEILQKNAGWEVFTSDCASDCILRFWEDASGDSILYHSSCGSFNDPVNNRHMSVSEEERQTLNRIFRNYISLYEDSIYVDGYEISEIVTNNADFPVDVVDSANPLLESLAKMEAIFPLVSSRTITSGFGFSVLTNNDSRQFHKGIDLSAAQEADILAVLDGTVIESGYSPELGNYLLLDHGQGLATIYAHCSELLVKEGGQVQKGDVIAQVGSSGRSFGPHLHFATTLWDDYFDPLCLFPDHAADSAGTAE